VQLALPQSIVEGRSMQPGLKEGQRVLISRLNYMFGDPEYGDIVVFNSPAPLTDEEPPLIKRVIGLPGDVVEFRDTLLYVNEQLIDEPYIKENCTRFQCQDRRWELGPDEYFVMGDNRNASRDSRAFGPVARHLIIGQALLRVWPPNHVEILDRYQ
jgi:signal peptidase I